MYIKQQIIYFTKAALADIRGSFATIFALATLGILMGVGVAVDFSRLQSTQVIAQDHLDSALLAAARSLSDPASLKDNKKLRLRKARKAAKNNLKLYSTRSDNALILTSLKLSDNALTATAKTKSIPYFANILGVKTLDVHVASATTLASQQAKDVDVVLIADATGSMQSTLDAIQANMKKFTRDLSNELTKSSIETGRVRVQFIFYRDYMIDTHKDWTGPRMKLQAGLEGRGPMYVSKFFEVPSEKNKMDQYVDYFIASGGGSFRESGLEAVWEALNTDWRDGNKTVRSIILWTDAQTRPLGDIEEVSLTPSYVPESYWTSAIGDGFNVLNKEQRQAYMRTQFYPKDMPSSLAEMKAKFAEFHAVNSNKMEGVQSMAINVINNCLGYTPCTDWPELAGWDGVDLTIDPTGVATTETYDRIVKQVAATVISQVTAKDIAITH